MKGFSSVNDFNKFETKMNVRIFMANDVLVINLLYNSPDSMDDECDMDYVNILILNYSCENPIFIQSDCTDKNCFYNCVNYHDIMLFIQRDNENLVRLKYIPFDELKKCRSIDDFNKNASIYVKYDNHPIDCDRPLDIGFLMFFGFFKKKLYFVFFMDAVGYISENEYAEYFLIFDEDKKIYREDEYRILFGFDQDNEINGASIYELLKPCISMT